METFIFVFKRQQFNYLMKSVALAAGAFVLTIIITALCYYYIGDEVKNSDFAQTWVWMMLALPALLAYFKTAILAKIPFGLFFGLIVLTTSLPLFWIVAKTSLWLIICAMVVAVGLFVYSIRKGLMVEHGGSFNHLAFGMFWIVAFCSLIVSSFAIFSGKPIPMFIVFAIAALIYVKINIFDVFLLRKKLPSGIGLKEKEINQVVVQTALNLYLNFIGMIFVIDFMKFLTKLWVETTPKKSVSK